ncbi:hypothetical protein MAR_014974 [Mya arenaria]|uniref:Sulfotransferase domain-containing protein n=1 Tax=Mya arenaria TaxID=6604 RepID=A0ABY7FG04_MYAAR|nr:hypothetical protein MAR_014974 [Mya arenaria]
MLLSIYSSYILIGYVTNCSLNILTNIFLLLRTETERFIVRLKLNRKIMFGSLSRWNSACIAFVLIAVVYQCWNYMHFIYMDAGVSVRGQVDSYEASINESPSRFDEKPNSLKYVSTYTSISNNQSTHLLKANEKLHSLRIPIDIMKLGPFPFLPNYKNPCWRTSSGVLRCLPYFHLIGCVKCGDGSPGTLVNNVQWEVIKHPEEAKALNRSEPVFANADLIHHLNPGAKIILMLRNPIDRKATRGYVGDSVHHYKKERAF